VVNGQNVTPYRLVHIECVLASSASSGRRPRSRCVSRVLREHELCRIWRLTQTANKPLAGREIGCRRLRMRMCAVCARAQTSVRVRPGATSCRLWRGGDMRRALTGSLAGVCLEMAVPVAVAPAPYSPPKTPWGDPDLQAIWSGDSAFGIPLQRPPALGTKAELTDAEFADKLKRDARTRTTAENAVGSFRNDNAWLTRS